MRSAVFEASLLNTALDIVKCLFFLPLFLFLLEKEMIPASKKLKRSVAGVRRSSASYSNNINSSWQRLLQKHNVSLSILLHIWSECKKSLECLTVKLTKLSTPKKIQECWLFSNQSQWSSGNTSKPQNHKLIITVAVCCLVFLRLIGFSFAAQ